MCSCCTIPIDPSFPRGRVTGVVRCAITGRSLPGATVHLRPRSDASLHEVHGVCDLDGTFQCESVPVGSYLVAARHEGYVSGDCLISYADLFVGLYIPNVLQLAIGSKDRLDRILSRLEVTEHETSSIELMLDQPGSIVGRAVWSNGSPAAYRKLDVMLLHDDGSRVAYRPQPWSLREATAYRTSDGSPHDPDGPDSELGLNSRREMTSFGETDADGNFRIDGLYTCRYIVGVEVPRFLKYARLNLEDQGPVMINCFSRYLWSGDQAYHVRAEAIDVVAGTISSGVHLTLPLTRHP